MFKIRSFLKKLVTKLNSTAVDRKRYIGKDDNFSPEDSKPYSESEDIHNPTAYMDDHDYGVNPANGLPMITSGCDICGNAYGTDFMNQSDPSKF